MQYNTLHSAECAFVIINKKNDSLQAITYGNPGILIAYVIHSNISASVNISPVLI